MKTRWHVLLCSALVITLAASSFARAAEVQTSEQPAPEAGAIATDSDEYVIGPEDVLLVYVWREESLTRTVPVRIDGKISIPLVNDVHAAGLTPLQLKERLTERLKEFIESPTVSITVMEANSFKVYISGEVNRPGVHLLRSEITLLRLLVMAGGFTEWAKQRKILIFRKEGSGEVRLNADYRKIIEGTEPDIPIKRGDMIIVR